MALLNLLAVERQFLPWCKDRNPTIAYYSNPSLNVPARNSRRRVRLF